MRALTAAQTAVRASGFQSEHMRVQVKDSGGTFRNLTTYPGTNLVNSASWRASVDDPHATADIILKREVEKLSLSPFVETSGLNRGFVPTTAAVPLLALGREIKIEVAIVPADKSPAAGDWIVAWHGYIDSIDPAQGDTIAVGCRDLGAKVMDAFIETERVYSYGAAGVSMRVWEPSTAYVLNEYILPSETKRNGKYYRVTTAGTSGATEPVWPAAGTVNDNTAVHTYESTTSTAGTNVEAVMQAILNNNGLSAVTLDVPTSPAWAITQFIQKREATLEALRTLAMQIGWDVRYVWDSGTSAFLLTLFEPDRAKAVADATFGADDYEDFRRLSIDISGIRNAIRVVYSDSADLWPDGTPKRKTVTVTDATSITAYGRRFAEVAEDSASQIDTSTEATAMATAMLTDLKSPTAEAEVVLSLAYPWVELGDLYTFTANGRHFDSDQTLAVYGWSHEAKDGIIKTSIQLGGQPSGGHDRWLKASVMPTGLGAHLLVPFQTTGGSSVVVAGIVGGARVTVTGAPDKNAHREMFEHHVSASASFTPSSSTLKEISSARTLEIANLVPGQTYYYAAVPLTHNRERVVRGQKSAETTFTAGRASAGHLDASLCDFLSVPLNGGFESPGTNNLMPDHWTAVTGTNATDFAVDNSTAPRSGSMSLEVKKTSVQTDLLSAFFLVEPSTVYTLAVWACRVGTATAGRTVNVNVIWYDYQKSVLSSSTLAIDVSALGTAWELKTLGPTSDASAAWARVDIVKAVANNDYGFRIDKVRVY